MAGKSGTILCATIVGGRAGEAIAEIAVATKNNVKLSDVASTNSSLSDVLDGDPAYRHQNGCGPRFLREIGQAHSQRRRLKILASWTPEAETEASNGPLHQPGTGTVLTRPPFPFKSTITQ